MATFLNFTFYLHKDQKQNSKFTKIFLRLFCTCALDYILENTRIFLKYLFLNTEYNLSGSSHFFFHTKIYFFSRVTKNRILIARKIAYLRHINAGTITYDAGNTLVFIVEDAIGSPKKEIKMKHFRNRFSLKVSYKLNWLKRYLNLF